MVSWLSDNSPDMQKLTRQLIEGWGGPDVYDKAERAVKRGAVLKAEMEGDVISGLYAQASSTISCRFKVLSNGLVESDCPCFKNRQIGQICEHVVALAISIMQRQNDPVRQQNYIEEQRRARRMEAGFTSAFMSTILAITSSIACTFRVRLTTSSLMTDVLRVAISFREDSCSSLLLILRSSQ